ncbi:hypothetical protein [Limnospira fusiformis]|uniref:hypothetical protein n=1 Tax=Limnospira fusiformis TaxID=54297 RepID=UPI0034E0620A
MFRTPEYFWFDPESLEFQGFALIQGTYQPITPNDMGHLWSEQLQLFLGIENRQLRFFSPDGVLVPTPEESATEAQQQLGSVQNKLVTTQNQLGSVENELVTTQNQLGSVENELVMDIFRTPEYFWFDPESLEFQGFALIQGTYQPITPNDMGHLWSEQLQLFLGIENRQLRFFSPDGVLVPTPEESATEAQQQLEVERQQKDKLAAKLRELGIDPEQL